MAFPTTPLDVKVELQLASIWTDVTAYTYTRDPITITRGRADEASQTEPSQCNLTFNNRDGRFSPRNPTGAYFGSIGRNTPARVSARLGRQRLFEGTATAPDTAGLSPTGDLDLRFDGRLASWAANVFIMSKYGAAGQHSWRLAVDSIGRLFFQWSADGTTDLTVTSTVPVPTLTGRQAVRATLDVDNGAAGNTVTFYTADTAAGTWAQLGDPVITAGVTSVKDSTAQVLVGSGSFIRGEAYSVEIRNGIGGSLVGNPIFTTAAEGAASFADAQGNTWTVASGSITNRRYRFAGEISNWPAKWDISGKDVWVPVIGSGITRRLGQGASPLESALKRGITREGNLVAYWPLEDVEGSTQFASGVAGAPALGWVGTPTLASDDSIVGSAPLPVLNGAVFTAGVPAATAGTIQMKVVFVVPLAGDTNAGLIMRVYTSGTAVASWGVMYTTAAGGTISMVGYNASGAVIVGPVGAITGANGARCTAVIDVTTSGANISAQFTALNVDTDVGGFPAASVVAGTVGAATAVQINGSPVALLVGMAVGHPHIRSVVSTNAYGLENYVRAWTPETPGRRIERICSEEGVAFTARGYLGPTSGSAVGEFQGVGPQPAEKLLDIVAEAVAVDLGILVEPRESLGLAYRPRESVYAQRAQLAVSYGNLNNLEPVEDDQGSRNDITTSREEGSSARARLESGALSVQAPPLGIGVYDDAVTLNVATDAQLGGQAGWRLLLGTVDEPRYPGISFGLEAPAFAASLDLTTAALDLDQGDLITISSPPAWMPPDQIRQIVQGLTERLEQFAVSIVLNCSPASPWAVGFYGDSSNTSPRYSSDGSTLAAGATSTATSWSVATPTGPLWTVDPTDLPLDLMCAGERVTVTAIAGAASPQTFTVTRSVNGVVKAQVLGATVDLFQPTYYAL